ncbi:MAG: ParB/RepB/Spo0J family partition protein [candidate division WOR-3 bacterium]
MTRKALGKGLYALLSEETKTAFEVDRKDLKFLRIEEVRPNPFQPRTDPNENLAELVASIKENGVLQPIVVRPKGDGYELVVGERRLRAAKEAGLETIPAIIKDIPERAMLELALVENLQRTDLNPIDEALAYKRLVDEFNLTHDGIAERVGKDRSTVTNALRLLTLPPKVRDYLAQRKISASHARALLAITNRKEQEAICERIVQEGLSVRAVEKLCSPKTRRATTTIERDVHIEALEDMLQQYLGSRVDIEKRGGRGQIKIQFYSEEDLDRIIKIITKTT